MSELSTLSVKNLIFTGVHGSTGRERLDPQRFQVDISLHLDISRAAESDKLQYTYDYKHAARIAEKIVSEEHHVLIETIASRIAKEICRDNKIHSAEVTLKKLNATRNGLPSITVEHVRSPQETDEGLQDFDVKELLDTLEIEGGVSLPILTDTYRRALLKEAESYTYNKQPEVVGPAKVREQLSSTYSLEEGSLFFRLRDDFQNLLLSKLARLNLKPFSPELDLNELSLQLYEKGSIGITPHMDGMSCRNLICIFVLTGHAKFALCDNREGENPRFLDTTPGSVIIMRGPGFLNSDFRPFHFLSDVTERRIVFGLRQKV